MARMGLVVVIAVSALLSVSGGSAVAKPPPLPNLVRNGSFERPPIPARRTQSFASIPGWTLAFGPDIELQNHVVGDPAVGNQFLELDSDASSGVFQRVPTRPGRLYRLQLLFSARPGTPRSENVLVVRWHGHMVRTITADGRGLRNTEWRMYAFKVRATGRSTGLELDDGGISDSVGTYVDAVTVTLWRGHPTAAR
jgi:hypothetical protein